MRARVEVYQFGVVLLEIAPPVWRTIQVPGTYNFWDLHVAIQDSMGWLDYHLHLFRMSQPGTGGLVQIGIPDEDAFEGDEPILPGWSIPIASYFTHPGEVAKYEYDFGDGWEHEVTLEAILPRQKGSRYPRCLAGERACPPEDCGGFAGYEDLMAVLRDPTHEEYESTLRWLGGGGFDPERFDAKAMKFDHPGRRWDLAFGKTAQRRRRGGRGTSGGA
ncbi:MAG: plasmid pRiA4b ORF-3 family protein [Candidatus Rokuibacteriota bacterium]